MACLSISISNLTPTFKLISIIYESDSIKPDKKSFKRQTRKVDTRNRIHSNTIYIYINFKYYDHEKENVTCYRVSLSTSKDGTIFALQRFFS